MTAQTLRPSAPPPARDQPPRAESVYRAVTALRADPRMADEALPPDLYLAAVDYATIKEPHP